VQEDERAKAATFTQARIWGNEGETIELVIDLASSYDLQGRPLEFTCRPLYANQKNLTVEDLGGGTYRLVARHDPALPKGRLPVIATARNGGPLPSSPVFVNFYWNEPDENPDFDDVRVNRLSPEDRREYESLLAKRGAKRYPVTRNRRPEVRFDIIGEAVRCRPGETVRRAAGAWAPPSGATTSGRLARSSTASWRGMATGSWNCRRAARAPRSRFGGVWKITGASSRRRPDPTRRAASIIRARRSGTRPPCRPPWQVDGSEPGPDSPAVEAAIGR